jgi:nitrogen fixation NifU-like protein
MTKEEIQDLYKAHILPENNNPYHFEANKNAGTILEAYNSMCGDKYQLYLNLDSKILDTVHFHGFGCAISKASTSLMLRNIEGLSAEDSLDLCQRFLNSVSTESIDQGIDQELQILAELKNFDGRMDCIKLSWEVLYNHLKSLG